MSPETTEMATGTSCRFCSRFCAVTMMSLLANGASASAGMVWAWAGAAASASPSADVTARYALALNQFINRFD
jgi:hypothetical protein